MLSFWLNKYYYLADQRFSEVKRWNLLPLTVTVLFSMIFLSACEKNNHGSLLSIEASDWIDLQVGNYWIYDKIVVNSAGDTTVIVAADSVYIKHDSIIGQHLYRYVVGWYLPGSITGTYLRDSAEYLIDNYGFIHFSAVPSAQPFFSWSGAPCSIDSTLTTNEYSMSWYTYNFVVGTIKPILTRLHYMDCIPFNGTTQSMIIPAKYALGVGMVEHYLVSQSVFYSGGLNRTGRKLRRYHIQ